MKEISKIYVEIRLFFDELFGLVLSENLTQLNEEKLIALVASEPNESLSSLMRDYRSGVLRPRLLSLISIFTVNHTSFFRENAHFDFFKNQALPEILKGLTVVKEQEIRVWSAAASSGEEAYSIIISMFDYLDSKNLQTECNVLATDIDIEALQIGEKGRYSEKKLAKCWKKNYVNYFESNEDNALHIKENLKSHVLFRWLNLNSEVYPMRKKFHSIFCRNVMLYFSEKSREKLIAKLSDKLYPGGYLFLGISETNTVKNPDLIQVSASIYRKKM